MGWGGAGGGGGEHSGNVRTAGRAALEGWYHPRSPPDGHHFLRGDGLGEKATVIAAATPALVTDAARARLRGGRGLRGGALLQLLQGEGEPSVERTRTRDNSEAHSKWRRLPAWVGLQRSRSARNWSCAASVTTSPASAEKAANYNASTAVVNGYGAAAAFSPGALQPQPSCSEMQQV